MALLDLLGRRWVLRILWELRDESLTFRELRRRCDDMSPTVLNQRLRELRETVLVESAVTGGYALSPLGQALLANLMPLLKWSEDWQTLRTGMASSSADPASHAEGHVGGDQAPASGTDSPER